MNKINKSITTNKKGKIGKLNKSQKEKIKLCKIGALPCPVCEHVSESLIDLRKHIINNHFNYFISGTNEYAKRIKSKINILRRKEKSSLINKIKKTKLPPNNSSKPIARKFIICSICKLEYATLERFKVHLKHFHFKNKPAQLEEYCIEIGISDKKTKFPSNKKFKIISKRGSKVNENFVCDICDITYSFGWKYKETTIGEACICSYCKDKYVRGRLSQNLILPGSFESSR